MECLRSHLDEDTEGATYPNDARLGTEPTDGRTPAAAAATATGLDGSVAIVVIYAIYAAYAISMATSGGIPRSYATAGYDTKFYSICCLFAILSGSFLSFFCLVIFFS